MHADFQTNENSQSNSQSIKIDTQIFKTKAKINASQKTLFLDKHNFYQDPNAKPYNDTSSTQNCNIFFTQTSTMSKSLVSFK